MASNRSVFTLELRNNSVQVSPRFHGSTYEHHISHLLTMHAQILTHARVLEMNITCCKMLQAKLLDREVFARLETRITLCRKMLEAMERVISKKIPMARFPN